METSKLQVAEIIKSQIGNQALFMIGAKNIAGSENSLQFKIGKNANGVTHIRITLNSLDLYDVEYIKINTRTLDMFPLAIDNDIYSDMLLNSIESNTGLYTKF